MIIQDPVTTTEIENFKDQFGGHWSEHHRRSISEWKMEVMENNTRMGYWEWVYQITQDELCEECGLADGYENEINGVPYFLCPNCQEKIEEKLR